jgi:hypothetical protein
MRKLLGSIVVAATFFAATSVYAAAPQSGDEHSSEYHQCIHDARQLIHQYHENCRNELSDANVQANHSDRRFCRGEHAFKEFLFFICRIEPFVETL